MSALSRVRERVAARLSANGGATSRRGFLRGIGLAGVLAIGLGLLAGCGEEGSPGGVVIVPQTFTISGTLENGSTTPPTTINLANITITGPNGTVITTQSGPNGTFTIGPLGPGTYSVSVPGFQPVQVVIANGNISINPLTLLPITTPTTPISFQIVNSAGQPIGNTQFTFVCGTQAPLFGATNNNASGNNVTNFLVPNTDLGTTCTVTIGGVTSTITISPTGNVTPNPVTVNVPLTTCTLIGSVSTTGQTNVTVTASFPGTTTPSFTTTEAVGAGTVTINQVIPSTITSVTFSAPNATSVTVPVVASANNTCIFNGGNVVVLPLITGGTGGTGSNGNRASR